jgi:hypothetical protein
MKRKGGEKSKGKKGEKERKNKNGNELSDNINYDSQLILIYYFG